MASCFLMRNSSCIQSRFVRYDLTCLDVKPEQTQIHGPAESRDAKVVIGHWPSSMPKSDPCRGVIALKIKSDFRASPVVVCSGHEQLKLGVRRTPADLSPPVVLWAEPEFVLPPGNCRACAALGPPTVEFLGIAHRRKDSSGRGPDWKVVQDISHLAHPNYFAVMNAVKWSPPWSSQAHRAIRFWHKEAMPASSWSARTSMPSPARRA